MNRKRGTTLGAVGLSIALAALPAFGQQAAPGFMNILIACGDENGTYAKCTSLDDRSLELRQGRLPRIHQGITRPSGI